MMGLLCVLLLVLAVDIVYSGKIGLKIQSGARMVSKMNWPPVSVSKAVAATIIAGSTLLPTSIALADDLVESGVTLTAAELKKNDVSPKISILKDILFVLKLHPSYIANQDYTSIRQSLRSEPAVELRRTCRDLSKYLDNEEVKAFQAAYKEMIESLDTLDVIALKRTQGEGVPSSKETKDDKMLSLSEDAVAKFNAMLSTLPSY